MRRRIWQPWLAFACTAVLMAAPSVAGAAGWLPATPPSPAANGPSGAVVALDPAGDAIAAWTDDDGAGTQSLLVATRPARGAWSTPAPLASSVAIDAPAVALDAAGNATVVWVQSDDGSVFTARAARRDALGGSWSAPHDFPAVGVADPLTQLRAGAAGDAVAAWVEHDPGTGVAFVRAAVADAAGAWSAPSTLSDPADASVAFDRPQIAADAGGGALVGWTAQRLGGTFEFALQTSTHLGGGAWSASPSDLLTSDDALSPLRLVGAGGGDAVATWMQGAPATLWSAFRLNGSWSVDGVSADVAPGCQPVQALGTDVDGGATVAWKAASTDGLEAVRLTVGGPDPQRTLFASRAESAEDVAIDRGTAVFVAHDDGDDVDSMLASRRGEDGGWSAPALLDAASPGTILAGPAVATDDAANALAGWTASDGSSGAKSLAAAAFQASGPHLSEVSVPASGTAGAPLAFAASASSTFATVAQTSWDFGDGSPAAVGADVSHAYATAGTFTVTVTTTDSVGNATQATRQVAIAAAPAPPPGPPPPEVFGDRGALLRPLIGGARDGVLLLARGSRTLKLVVRNPNGPRLTGSARLVRPRAHGRPALTLASRRRVRFAGKRRTTVALRLTDQALRALARASGFRLPIKAVLHLRAADGRRVSATLALTLDASRRFVLAGAGAPTARTAC